ncbi:S8 family peptidase [Bacillus sp. FJAT-47783]|uniref:S8 family peptidase n=1 Tax=Bacillus sp. FJAT-47783 TaxID=2922712 RepID=UPI001FAB6E01|nr:S8 family peptidase [Bacillus sp. FJAT-47783]
MVERKVKLVPYTTEETLDTITEVPEGIQMVQAPSLWNEGVKGKRVVIAVLDTGCDIHHPDLKGQIIGGRNFTTDDNRDPKRVTDYNGHGTHVAGTIAAKENNRGVIGVAPEAKLLILKVLGTDPNNSKSATGRYEWIINAIHYAIKQKVDIISMSLGGPSHHPGLHDAIKKAVNENILVVCAAGNEGDGNEQTNEFTYPGAYNEVISVGAVSARREASLFTNSNNEVDLVAPGEKIRSTIPDGKYASLSGTSMATPHVSGALALLKQETKEQFERTLSEPELYAQLIKRTVPLGNAKTLEGNGLLYLTTPNILSRYVRSQQTTPWFLKL